MGLSVVISGTIVMFSMFFIMSAFPVIAENTFKVSQSSTEISHIENQITQTSIDITSITVSPGNQDISITLDNIGNKKLWDYEKFDVIVKYDTKIASQDEVITEKLSYVDSCPTVAGEWCIQSISPDNMDSGILNSEETAQIDGTVTTKLHPSTGTITVSISTDNGVSTTSSVVF